MLTPTRASANRREVRVTRPTLTIIRIAFDMRRMLHCSVLRITAIQCMYALRLVAGPVYPRVAHAQQHCVDVLAGGAAELTLSRRTSCEITAVGLAASLLPSLLSAKFDKNHRFIRSDVKSSGIVHSPRLVRSC